MWVRAEIYPNGEIRFSDRSGTQLGKVANLGVADEWLKSLGATGADDVEWVMVKEPRRKREVVEFVSRWDDGIAAGRRNSCMAIACARIVAPDPTNSDQVAVLIEEVISRFPRKPRRRGTDGWTPAGMYYGSTGHALKSLGVPYTIKSYPGRPTVDNYLDRQLGPTERTIIKVRKHVGVLHDGKAFDLKPRKHVIRTFQVAEDGIPQWARDAVDAA